MPRLQSLLLGDFDILIKFPYIATQADLLVSELFFIASHYSDKLLSGLGGRQKIIMYMDEPES